LPEIKGTIIMQFPIFYGFVAPDIAASKPVGALNTASDLTAKLDGQLSVAIGALRISMPNILVSKTVEDIVASEHRRCVDSAVAAREKANDMGRSSGLTIHTEILRSDFDQFQSQCVCRARVHGLVFAEAGIAGEFHGAALIESLLFKSGRPVLIVPSGYSSEISLQHTLIAWDGSVGAARAVWNAMPLLRLAQTIEIVTVVGEKQLEDVPAGNMLAPMLSFLQKKTNVTTLKHDGGTAASPIKQYAAKTGAGLIIQGAYGRSRWSELILGGATRDMLHDNALPVLMSY
jgi:nucleotide-binding universal stress UspA family protein